MSYQRIQLINSRKRLNSKLDIDGERERAIISGNVTDINKTGFLSRHKLTYPSTFNQLYF